MISENQIIVDWLLDTGDLAIIIQPKQYNIRDIVSLPDAHPNTMTTKEAKWRAEFEAIKKDIVKYLNQKDKK